MEFHNWTCLLDEMRNACGKEVRDLSLKQKFEREARNLLKYPFKDDSIRMRRLMRLCMEFDWLRVGKPYYNVHPLMCEKLAKINLDAIPARHIEIPENFPAILVRFTDPIPIRMFDGSEPFNLERNAIDLAQSPVGMRAALFGRYNFDNEPMLEEYLPSERGKDHYLLIVDEGGRCTMEGIQRTLLNNFLISVSPNQTIPEAFSDAIDKTALIGLLMQSMRTRLENLFRIIVTIGFLSDAPEGILVPDILSKDRRKWDEAQNRGDTGAMRQIEARSRRRGKLGWNVGTTEMFVENHPVSSRSTSGGSGKELQYSHIRGGHPHAVRCGTGKSKVKIKWYRATRVRSDLPFKPD